jgi:hypothetical protein
MEVNFGKQNRFAVCVYEALGTAILVFGINLTNGNVL